MIKVKIILVAMMFVCAPNSRAHSDEKDGVPIRQLINEYAGIHQTNFILSSQVVGEVNIAGLTVEKMSVHDLERIFRDNGFIAIEKNKIIYLYTKLEVENLGKGVGPLWRR